MEDPSHSKEVKSFKIKEADTTSQNFQKKLLKKK